MFVRRRYLISDGAYSCVVSFTTRDERKVKFGPSTRSFDLNVNGMQHNDDATRLM